MQNKVPYFVSLAGLKYLHLHASKDGINIYRKAGFVEPAQKELELRLE